MTAPTSAAAVDAGRLVAAHRAARAFYRRQLLDADGPRRYLHARGLGAFARQPGRGGGVDQPWHLGYAPPGWTTLVNHLTRDGFAAAELVAAGLATPTRRGGPVDVFRDRIVFPIHNQAGEPIAFLGRAAPTAGADVAKYINSVDTPIYRKRHALYGLGEQADRVQGHAAPVVVEGPTDVLAVWHTNPDPTSHLPLAACGTNLTEHHATTLAALSGARSGAITTAFDNDSAGRNATLRAWRLLSVHKGISLNAAVLPPGADPASLAANGQALADALASAEPLAQAVIDITLDDLLAHRPDALRFVEGRVHILHSLAAMLIDLPPHQIADLARHIAERTGSRIDLVADIIIDHLERDPDPARSAPARDGPPPHPQPSPAAATTVDRTRHTFPPPTRPTPPAPAAAAAAEQPATPRPRRSR